MPFPSARVGTCEPSLANATSCFVMETEVIIFMDGPVSEDVAAYEAYSAIENSMANGSYIGSIPTVVKLEFLSPLPLPAAPPGADGGNGTVAPIVVETSTSSGTSVNPWTIGASVATMMGGVVSVLLWARSRRVRQSRQHTS